MQPAEAVTTDLVLLGAGHAHVEVLRRLAIRPLPGVRVTLIGREPDTPYSGMLPGLIRGDYTSDEAHIDLAPLASAAGARLILAEATGLDLASRTVTIAGRPDLAFDLLSLDVGGEPAMATGGVAVKPIGRFLGRLAALEADLPAGARIAVVGSGPAGAELSLALTQRLGARARIVLVCDSIEPLPAAPPRARAIVRAALVEAGVELVCGVRAGAHADGRLALSDGSFLQATETLWATNAIGPAWLAASGLACDDEGCVVVDATLNSVSHNDVFAAGDCASIRGAKRPKAGVWAVRAGAPLTENLRRAVLGRALRPWRPQSQALVILGLGQQRAVAWRNGIAVAGHLVWRWKDYIDRRWMRMYVGGMAAEAQAEAMRCGGCGAKVGANLLSEALATLPLYPGPDVLIGLEAPDDAAVSLPPAGMALVQSVDQFRAFIDDPFVFGQIAAAHAVSDLHAMGARPWTALAVAALPYMRADKLQADLAAMMRGAIEVLAADGCALVGGHTAEAAEAALGFAVTGLADPTKLWRKSGLRPGDALLLTKPLGTGIVLAAQMRGKAKARWLQAAIDSMRQTNATAAGILARYGVHACTDVTGFGLAGHLMEMLRASSVAATLRLEDLPVLPGALDLASAGIASTLAPENQRLLPDRPSGPLGDLLVDPQTSGGLLAGLAPEFAAPCLAALRQAGLHAAIIGSVEAGAPSIGV